MSWVRISWTKELGKKNVWTLSFLEDVSPLIREASSVLGSNGTSGTLHHLHMWIWSLRALPNRKQMSHDGYKCAHKHRSMHTHVHFIWRYVCARFICSPQTYHGPNQSQQTSGCLMWGRKSSVVVIFARGSGEGFRYFHATIEWAVSQSVLGYKTNHHTMRSFRSAKTLSFSFPNM